MVSVVLTEDPEDLRKKRREQWWGAYNDTKWYVIEPMAFWKAACVAASPRRLQRRRTGGRHRRDAPQVRRLHSIVITRAGLLHPVLDRVSGRRRIHLVRLVSVSVVLGRHFVEFLLALRERGGLGDEPEVDRGGVFSMFFL